MRRRAAATVVAAGVLARILAGPAGAADANNNSPPTGSESAPSPQGNSWDKTLLGDLGGVRSALDSHGLTFGLSETSEVLGNVSGGIRRGAIYEGLTDTNLQWDLRKKNDWQGVFYARAFQIHGRGLSASNLNNVIIASSIEAVPSTRLFELWYEHYLTDRLRIKIGEQAADQEFLISTTSKLFVNSTFGWPALAATDLPSGGPAYPLSTPAIRLRIDPSDEIVLLAGVFNGDPAGPGPGNPQRRDASGTSFRTGDGVLALVEGQYNPGHSPQNGTYKLGAWFDSQRSPDPHFATNGVSLASPLSSGTARLIASDFSVYGVVDQPIGADKEGKGLSAFARAMGAPGDRNLVDFYFDCGLAYKGPFGRDDDQVGVGYGYARIGGAARALDADTAAFTGKPFPVRTRETVIEVS